jgi:hypothetical protein
MVAFRHGLKPFEVGQNSLAPIDLADQDRGNFDFIDKVDIFQFESTDK